MKLRPSVLATLALPSFAAATPARRTEPTSQCTTGTLQCCNSVQAASSAAASLLLGLLGVVLQDLTIPIGISCSPITVIGAGDSSWLVDLRALIR